MRWNSRFGSLLVAGGLCIGVAPAAMGASVPGVGGLTRNGTTIDPDDVEKFIKIIGGIVKPGFTSPLNPAITIDMTDTEEQFTLKVNGGNLGSNTTQTFNVTGLFWTGTLGVTQDAAETFLNDDVLSVTGTIQHVDGPHDDDGMGGTFSYSFVLDGDDLEQVKPANKTDKKFHPNGHVDSFTGPDVIFTTVRNIVGDDITSYAFVVEGNHAIPLPAAVWTALITLGGMGTIRWRNKVRRGRSQ